MSMRAVRSLALLAGLSAAGCADQQESLIVLHAPVWPDDGACEVEESQDAALLVGRLDLQFQTGYLMPAVLLNQLQEQVTTNSGIDNSEVQLRDADVTLSMPQQPEIIDALKDQDESLVDFNVPLSSNSIMANTRAGVAVEVITQPAAVALGSQITARFPDSGIQLTVIADVVFHGLRTGNTAGKIGVVDARTFSFPIALCTGCLIDCSTCPMAQCPVGTSDYVGGVCGNAQDVPLVPAACATGN